MRLIDADDLINLTKGTKCEQSIMLALGMVPTVDAEPVRHGHWMARNALIREPFGKNYDCSACGVNNIQYAYCPNCGAKMDEVTE